MMIGLLYTVLSIAAVGALIWGVGSAMMNGTRYSSLGPSLLVAAICGAGAAALYQIATP